MKSRYVLIFAVVIFSLLALTILVAAQELADDAVHQTSATSSEPISVRTNIGADPTVDPALVGDRDSAGVVEQLFIGLYDVDDETAEAVPELANGISVSGDGLVYTFTLRTDAYWSDGNPITASDVRYGILRTLDPVTNAQNAYLLYIIQNAQDYNEGLVNDPNVVGVEVLNPTTLKITLENEAAYLPAILAISVARPMPAWAINAHGANWTEPGNIVTSGPYRLSEWNHNNYLVMDKNSAFFDSAGVQIEKITFTINEQNTAWQMYLNDQLDTVQVPLGTEIGSGLEAEIHWQSNAGTYIYGFSVSQAPFDNPLVRKAFSAATNRVGLLSSIDNQHQPALTLTAPGIFGHVDGYAEGVGHPYSPTLAQQYLSDAGYPGGAGLPPITLWYNTSVAHQQIAEYVRDSWFATLGVSVTLDHKDWPGPYRDFVDSGQAQAWRMGWTADYQDAYSFLGDFLGNRDQFGGWSNSSYDTLLEQATGEQDPAVRSGLYKQMEEILVESDAVMIPLYYYGTAVAAKPYLERNYPAAPFDVADWRIQSQELITTDGGSLISLDEKTIIEVPAGAFTGTIKLTHMSASEAPASSDMALAGRAFEMTAVYSDSGQSATLQPGSTYTVSVSYSPADVFAIKEDTLSLYYWNGMEWVKEPSSVLDTEAKKVSAGPNHFSLWAVMGEQERVYIPFAIKGS